MSLRRRQVVYFPTSHPKYLLHTVIDSTLINISQSVQAIRNKWVTSVNVTYRSRAVMEALNCFVSSHLQMCCSTFSLSEIQLHAFGFQIAQSFQRSWRSHICMWNAMAFDTTGCPEPLWPFCYIKCQCWCQLLRFRHLIFAWTHSTELILWS